MEQKRETHYQVLRLTGWGHHSKQVHSLKKSSFNSCFWWNDFYSVDPPHPLEHKLGATQSEHRPHRYRKQKNITSGVTGLAVGFVRASKNLHLVMWEFLMTRSYSWGQGVQCVVVWAAVRGGVWFPAASNGFRDIEPHLSDGPYSLTLPLVRWVGILLYFWVVE